MIVLYSGRSGIYVAVSSKQGIFAEPARSILFVGMVQTLEEGKFFRKEKVLVLITLSYELDIQMYDYDNYRNGIYK